MKPMTRCTLCTAPSFEMHGWRIHPPLCWPHFCVEVEKVHKAQAADPFLQKFRAERQKMVKHG